MRHQGNTEKLFTNEHPQSYGYKKHAEDDFTYLNQHADAPVAAAKQMMEEWCSRFPSCHRRDLVMRFRSKDMRQHTGAFWELYLHELFLRMNFTVEVHPSLGQIGTRPDFLLSRDGIQIAYVECRLAGLPKEETVSAKRLEAELHDALDMVHSPNFFLHIQEIRTSPNRPSFKSLVSDIEKWLTTLDPDLPLEAFLMRRHTDMRFKWEDAGWYLAVRVIPKSPEYRGRNGRSVGAFGMDVRWLDTKGELKRALNEKANKYGDLKLPFLIAVNYMGPHCDRTDWTDALFGSSAVNVWFAEDDTHFQEPFRKPDGFWVGNRGFRNTHVSGIMAAWHITPWTVGAHALQLYAHPAAVRPIDLDGNLPCWYLQEGEDGLKIRAGLSSAALLNIPDGWPGTWDREGREVTSGTESEPLL